MEQKKANHPIWIIILLFLLPPVGLVLLGEQKTVKSFYKYSISLCYVLLLFIFLLHYQIAPKTNQEKTGMQNTEKVQYKMTRVEYPFELVNGVKETINRPENEQWIHVFLEITNEGSNKLYYISLTDNPIVLTGDEAISPDLSLSFEPFGEILPGEMKSGYLVFRLPASKKGITFQIASYTANLQSMTR